MKIALFIASCDPATTQPLADFDLGKTAALLNTFASRGHQVTLHDFKDVGDGAPKFPFDLAVVAAPPDARYALEVLAYGRPTIFVGDASPIPDKVPMAASASDGEKALAIAPELLRRFGRTLVGREGLGVRIVDESARE